MMLSDNISATTEDLCGVYDPDLSLYYVEYDKEPFYERMQEFRETVFDNRKVPYIWYFRDGRLVGTGNLLWLKRWFLRKFGHPDAKKSN